MGYTTEFEGLARKGMGSLTSEERAILLRCRYAGRYDAGTPMHERRANADEALEEQAASSVPISNAALLGLQARGLVTLVPCRLTAAGRAALAKVTP